MEVVAEGDEVTETEEIEEAEVAEEAEDAEDTEESEDTEGSDGEAEEEAEDADDSEEDEDNDEEEDDDDEEEDDDDDEGEDEEDESEKKAYEKELKKAEKRKAKAERAAKISANSIFAKKYDSNENILTIFKDKKLYGALIGELIGTMMIAILLMTFGANYILYIMLAMIAIYMAVYTLSGAHLNPIVTAGMMATRRISPIRGVLYILAQVLGAGAAFGILSAFKVAGNDVGTLPEMAATTDATYWITTVVELCGALIIGFAFARALQYRRSVLTFAIVAVGGAIMALVLGLFVSGNFLGLSNNYIMNPAVALMYQIFPSEGDNVGQILAGIGKALVTYTIIPMVGGIVGFYLSDFASKLKGEKLTTEE